MIFLPFWKSCTYSRRSIDTPNEHLLSLISVHDHFSSRAYCFNWVGVLLGIECDYYEMSKCFGLSLG